MTDFDFSLETFDEAIARITEWNGGKIEEAPMLFDNDAGKGCLMAIEIEKGLFVRGRNYLMKEESKFRIASGTGNRTIQVMITYLLTPENFLIVAEYEWPAKKTIASHQNNIIVSSNQSGVSVITKAGRQVKAVDICFTLEWLTQQFPGGKNLQAQPILFQNEDNAPVRFGALSISDYKIVSEMLEHIINHEPDVLFLRSRTLTLVSDMISSIYKKSTQEKKTPANISLIIEIERRICSTLNAPLPNLKEIAKEYSIGESTLKRQFKKVYGMALYEYYLRKKMEQAKYLLTESEISVTQVAYTLGYEKVSSFINAFKRQFGVSPGALRGNKNNASFDNNH